VDDSRALYLNLLKRCLLNWIYGDAEYRYVPLSPALQKVSEQLDKAGLRVIQPAPVNRAQRSQGNEMFPAIAHTMVGEQRLNNAQFCVEEVLRNHVPGDMIETGVWRGGTCILMRGVLQAYGVRDRKVWVADSFRGLPRPDAAKYPADKGLDLSSIQALAISRESVMKNFDAYGLLDEQVMFLEGWFKDTLPTAPISQLAVLRLDGDLYESTMDGLVNLYPKLSPGGYVIVDDYGAVEACARAVHDFRAAQGITDEIHRIDWTGVFWRRSS